MPENQRLFIAVFPPLPLRRRLHQLARQQHARLGGRCMPAANLHLTLAFLGQTPAEQIPLILDILERQPDIDCSLVLDTLGCFGHGGIAWAGCKDVPAGLTAWVAGLRTDLLAQGIAFDSKPFKVHITLLRKAGTVAETIEPALNWQLGRAQLYASQVSESGGSSYQMLSSAA